jgi:DNA-directed RNA polymerase specialized sigma24 family protein
MFRWREQIWPLLVFIASPRGVLMSLRETLGPQIPYLRRYARALTGSQSLGDAAVRETLQALLEAPHELDEDRPARLELYRVFHKLWSAETIAPVAVQSRSGIVANLPMASRQSLLLTTVEGFSSDEVAEILDLSADAVRANADQARDAIADALTARVLVIEDESIIAMHIKAIVEQLGHDVVAVVRTRDEAVASAADLQPDLVLADISLADGSSGIDAVKDILAEQSVPVIFITAFPERLLTGERPEPAYVITKPFEPETVTATIGQALLVHRETADAMS